MASNGASRGSENTKTSLEKIKRQLASGSGRNLLQGPLLKRSETLRKWNERWVILDPTTGKMEYKAKRNEPTTKGVILFDANSTITISPVNIHGLPKYDGCCFYIGTPQKKDYFLCAETPAAARAWVSTLHATQLVLKAHKEAVNSLSGNGSSKLGTVATVVAAANSTALEASKDIEAALQISMRNALGAIRVNTPDTLMDDMSIMKETLRVKDEELQNLARDLRAKDSTIKGLAEKLSETAEAAEGAASAARIMDEQRKIACTEVERLKRDSKHQLESSMSKIRELEEKTSSLIKERDQAIKQRDLAMEEALLWRNELGKAREQVIIMEGAVFRAEEKARLAEAVAMKEKQEMLAHVTMLQNQLKRHQDGESCSSDNTVANNSNPETKHMDPSEEKVDKACLSVSRDIQATELAVADVREVGPEMDIPIVTSSENSNQEQGEL